MADITPGEENDVPLGTELVATTFNVTGIPDYVFGVVSKVECSRGIVSIGGPGGGTAGQAGPRGAAGGAGVSGFGGNAGEYEGVSQSPGPGVVGNAGTGGDADGVRGFGSGSFSGVAGFGDQFDTGAGVFGQGRGPGAPGVRGIGSGGPDTVPGDPAGVYGQAGKGNANGVEGHGSGELGAGVAGLGDPSDSGTGVLGVGRGPGAPGMRGIGSGGNPDTSRSISPAGVFGQAGSGNANGVEGRGSGNFAGVAGFGDASNGAGSGIGVFAVGGAPAPRSSQRGGPGVHAIGAGGAPFSPLNQEVGVFGLGGANNAPGVLGQGGSPAADGVQGFSASGSAISGESDSGVGVRASSSSGTGVVAEGGLVPGSIGLIATGRALAARFDGNVLANDNVTVDGNVTVNGDLTVKGAKHAAVAFPDGTHRVLYCLESPESWFEDFGFGTLVNGCAAIRLDPDFAATVHTGQYHVFVTEYGIGWLMRKHGLIADNLLSADVVTALGERLRASASEHQTLYWCGPGGRQASCPVRIRSSGPAVAVRPDYPVTRSSLARWQIARGRA
jgi:hypothetical protein